MEPGKQGYSKQSLIQELHQSYRHDWWGKEQEQEQADRRLWLQHSRDQQSASARQSTPLPVLLALLVSSALLLLQLLGGLETTAVRQMEDQDVSNGTRLGLAELLLVASAIGGLGSLSLGNTCKYICSWQSSINNM